MVDEDMVKTTPEDFEIFKVECQRWIDFWGLYGWNINYAMDKLEGDIGANIQWNVEGRIVKITLSSEYPKDVYCEERIRKAAFHEVDELRFCRVQHNSSCRYLSGTEEQEAFHELIRQDENKIFYNPLLNPKVIQ